MIIACVTVVCVLLVVYITFSTFRFASKQNTHRVKIGLSKDGFVIVVEPHEEVKISKLESPEKDAAVSSQSTTTAENIQVAC